VNLLDYIGALDTWDIQYHPPRIQNMPDIGGTKPRNPIFCFTEYPEFTLSSILGIPKVHKDPTFLVFHQYPGYS
jgi:hypothetical protein